jgi:predicted MPP superfamily phosphohydrolase
MRVRKRLIRFILIIQSALFLTHLLVFETWTYSAAAPYATLWVKLAAAILSVSFVGASLLGFRYINCLVSAFYRVAAVWLGWLTFLVLASLSAWIVLGITKLASVPLDFHLLVESLFGAAIAAGIYAVLNANWTRTTRISVQLPNLPSAWRGRRVALISDVHLGHVRNGGFLRRMVSKILHEQPDAVLIAGDLYDGTPLDAERAAEPLRKLKAPGGVYFIAGNHEQFEDDTKYLNAVANAGVRVLRNEKVDLEGLQIVGISYRDAANGSSLVSMLRRVAIDRSRPSIFLTHAPDHSDIAEAAGFSLQLCGHTHLGQYFPFTWIVRRMYGQFAYGLSRIGNMQAYTSSGAGTWGPPLRLGSNSEIVVLKFE